MRRLLAVVLFLALPLSLQAAGLLIPEDLKVPPLAMVSHRVSALVDDQVGVTNVEQVFRNHTDRPLEATYLFPVPKHASVDKFVMWIDGKETRGELLDAQKARQIYTEIVRRTLDPGLLEYVGQDLLKLRVFPVPPRGDVKVKVRFTAVAHKDRGVIEYTYPMRTDGKATRTLEDFSVRIALKSQLPISTIYSPTHAISILRAGSREATIEFEKKQALLDRDFQLFYGVNESEIGLTPICYKPITSDDGYFLLLISPDMEATKVPGIPRDLVMVLDTSGSMSDVKMNQARNALKHCLNHLGKDDRFALISFATTVNTYADDLNPTTTDHLERANKWVDDLRQGGGTAILPALLRALEFRGKDTGRPFTIAFFTDGMPTVGETDPWKIVKAVTAKNNSDTRIFTFGVGDDVNAAMLDQLSEATKAVSTYVRPAEDIEAKVSSLFEKIRRPVLTNVRLSASNVKLHEVYPPAIPDLFYGSQLVVFGRYSGHGSATIRLTGEIEGKTREFTYECEFPAKSSDGKDFVEHLWARRKVGFILDQIRINGESKELVAEVTALAKKYGIATPYTSYLVVPDGPLPVAERGRGDLPVLAQNAGAPAGQGLGGFAPAPGASTAAMARTVAEAHNKNADGIAGGRGIWQEKQLDDQLKNMKPEDRKNAYGAALAKAQKDTRDNQQAAENFKRGALTANQVGQLGVDLALASNQLRNQERLTITANRRVQGRNCVEIGGVWIDDQFQANQPTIAIKAQSDAYFKLLEKQPGMKDVLVLGNHVVWVTPSGTAIIIDPREGKESIDDAVIEQLFRQ